MYVTDPTPVRNNLQQATAAPYRANERFSRRSPLRGMGYLAASLALCVSAEAGEAVRDVPGQTVAEVLQHTIPEVPQLPVADPELRAGTGYVSPRAPTNAYLDAIERVEGDHGPYATELSDLFMGLGQSLMTLGDYEQAKDAFHRGVLVVRVNSGPNSPEQTNHLFLMANIETVLGEQESADEILNNIRHINTSYYGDENAEVLPVLERIYEWYQVTRPPGSPDAEEEDYERNVDLTEQMVEISEAAFGANHPGTALAYRRMGEAQFQYLRHQVEEGDIISNGFLRTQGVHKVSGGRLYDAAHRAFKQYLESLEAIESATPLERAEALARYGDWCLAFGQTRKAQSLFEQAYQTVAESEEDEGLADSYLGQPRPLHFLNDQPVLLEDMPEELLNTHVQVSMTVTNFGDLRYIEVLNRPENITDSDLWDISRQLLRTPFRPAIKGGEAVTTEGFVWQYALAARGNTL